MKPSYYNHYIPLETGEYILYNTLSGDTIIVDQETKDTIDNIHTEEPPEDVLKNLILGAVVVDDSENELLKIRDRYNAVRYNPHRLSFVLAPTVLCNLSCEYCYQRIDWSLLGEDIQATMSESTLNNVLLFMKNMAAMCRVTHLPLTFYGGESLMTKELVFRILDELTQWGQEHAVTFEAGFYTNCTLFDRSVIDSLQNYAITFVRATLDGPRHIHDHYRHYKNGKGTYQDVLTNMGELLDAGINVIAHITINRHYKSIPELFDDLAENGLKKVGVTCYPLFDPLSAVQEVQKTYGILPEDFAVPQSEYALPLKDVPSAKAYIYRTAFTKGFRLSPPNLGLLIPCYGAEYYHYAIDPAGDVYKCIGSMFMKSMRVGHIHAQGYMEKFPFLYEWMDIDPTSSEKCQLCSFLPSCGGGCIMIRKAAQLPAFCEMSSFPGEYYIKMYLEQQYAENLKSPDV